VAILHGVAAFRGRRATAEVGHREALGALLPRGGFTLFLGLLFLDDFLRVDASSYVRLLLTGDATTLTTALAGTAATLSVNWPLFTSEVRYTDRVLTFPRAWPRTVANS